MNEIVVALLSVAGIIVAMLAAAMYANRAGTPEHLASLDRIADRIERSARPRSS